VKSSRAYDVVLLGTPEMSAAAVAVSRALQNLGARFQLDEGRVHPHMSILMAQLRDDSLPAAVEALKTIAGTIPALRLAATRYDQDHEQGFFEVQFERPAALVRLQEAVIDQIEPLRDGLRDQDPPGRWLRQWMSEAQGDARSNLDRYGYDEIGTLFRPHVTFTRFSDPQAEVDRGKLPPPQKFSGLFPILALFEMGEHGTCIRSVAEFTMKDS
jgi:2'-5' RNA ligase